MGPITGLHVAYWAICPRKLWLWARGIRQDNLRVPEGRGSERIAQGRILEESAYPRRPGQQEGLLVEADGFRAKVDFYDPRTQTLHETKLSDAMEEAHEWQVLFYLFVLNRAGMTARQAILEYPKLRQRQEIPFTPEAETRICQVVERIRALLEQDQCPPLLHAKRCKSCAFHDFCYAGEALP